MELTKNKLQLKIKKLGKISAEQEKEICCSLIGHSHIVDSCFGYITCSRCGEQLGDTLMGMFDLKKYVIIGHSCETCIANYKKMTWRDKYLVQENVFGEITMKKLKDGK